MSEEKRFPADHEVYDFLEDNPAAKSALATWLASGGEEVLNRMDNMVRGGFFPYTAPQHVQASFGAFLGGIGWAVRTLRNAVDKANSSEERRRMGRQVQGNVDEVTDALLDRISPGWRDYVKTKEGE